MLRLLLCENRAVLTRAVMDELCTRKDDCAGRDTLIVPEQFSFSAERMLCKRGGNTISRYAEVLSFTRLAGRVASVCGGVASGYLDAGGRLLTITLAASQVQSQLKVFAGVRAKPNFLRKLLKVIDEFESYLITPDMLLAAADEQSGQFSVKLAELAMLYESYRAVTGAGKHDPILRLQRLSQQLQEDGFAEDGTFYLDGFLDFTRLEQRILAALCRSASLVTVALPDGAAFSSTRETIRMLTALSRTSGVPMQTIRIPVPNGDDALSYLHQMCFASAAEPFLGDGGAVRLFFATTDTAECRAACARIRTLVAAGDRYRDIAIVSNDAGILNGILPGVLDRAGIPYHLSAKRVLSEFAPVRTLLFALEAVTFGMELETVISFLKTGFTPLSDAECDQLENYAACWKIRGSSWESEWTMNPFCFERVDDAKLEDTLIALNRARREGLSALLDFKQAMDAAANSTQMVEALADLSRALRLSEETEALCVRLRETGDFQRAQEFSQVLALLEQALFEAREVLCDSIHKKDEFFLLIKALFSEYEVGSVPSTLDQVLLGDFSSCRYLTVKHLIVLGASEEYVPGIPASDGLLTEAERAMLRTDGISLAPSAADQLDRQMSVIACTLQAACVSLLVSARADSPSFLFRRISRLFPQTPEAEQLRFLDMEEAAAEWLRTRFPLNSTPPEAFLSARDVLRKKTDYRFTNISTETIHRLYGREIRLSASRIDQYAACRYAYFLRYGLGAKKPASAEISAPEFGTFVHAVLEETVREVMNRGGFHTVPEEELLTIAASSIDRYLQTALHDLGSLGQRPLLIFRRNREEVLEIVRDLGAELRVSRFEPREFELEFSDRGTLPAIHVEGRNAKCKITGFVDRVDFCEMNGQTYVRVVDYKTGVKKFDYTDILHGKGMQMLLYLFALKLFGAEAYGRALSPAGVLYFPARRKLLTVSGRLTPEAAAAKRRAEYERSGLLLDSDAVLSAMEETDGQPHYLPYKQKKDAIRTGSLASEGELALLEAHVFSTLREMTDAINGGSVQPNPILRGAEYTSCTYCEFASACHRDCLPQEQRYDRKVTADELFAQLKKKEAQGHV